MVEAQGLDTGAMLQACQIVYFVSIGTDIGDGLEVGLENPSK